MQRVVKHKSPLLPERHPEGDFFVCDIFDAIPKADIASMEHPIFSLSTKRDNNIRRYENNGIYVEIKPGADGLATIHDRDILIYCISQLMAAMRDGRPISPTINFKAYDLLIATNRKTDGRSYARLKASLERLRGTLISTNILTAGKETFEVFGLIERAKIVRQTRDGQMQDVEIKLSDWVFNAIEASEVLTLNREYFRLRKPLERRIYEIARKHCGRKQTWCIHLALLQKKCGSTSSPREFKRMMNKIIEQDIKHAHIPDYSIRMQDDDLVEFKARGTMDILPKTLSNDDRHPVAFSLNTETYQEARQCAPEWDIDYLETQWRNWMDMSDHPFPKNPDRAFIGFCKKWFEKRGRP